MEQREIDLVIAYVNNKDQVWRKTYIEYCKTHNLNKKIVDMVGCRYEGIDFLKYQLRLVEKNMPFIRNIYLLLSNKEQAPKDLPSNCHVVLHKDFIPQQYLPTFNSTTIEMFLWNIPNLSEYFIYANDDMLPTGKLSEDDFFENNLIKIKWLERAFSYCGNTFQYQCMNNCLSLSKKLKLYFDRAKIIKPLHSFTPMIKSHCVSCYKLLEDLITPYIRAFRNEYQHNQYIYPLYDRYVYGTIDSDIDFLYTELDRDFDLNHQIVCVNLEKNSTYVKKFLEEIEKVCE